jgi:hypothetical protein
LRTAAANACATKLEQILEIGIVERMQVDIAGHSYVLPTAAVVADFATADLRVRRAVVFIMPTKSQ